MAKHSNDVDEFDNDAVSAGENGTGADVAGSLGAGAQAAIDQARTAASGISSALPGAAATAGDAARQMQSQMSTMSDEGLAVGAALSLGAALGMLISGSNRLLVLLALIPAIAMGSYLVQERRGTSAQPRVH